jgi:N-sulfoglucosamine sulfohydrolase
MHCDLPAPPRRRWLLLSSLALATAVAVARADDNPTATPRPNILWLVSEDNTAFYTGPYGNPLARTPIIDRLAAEGTTFDNFHAAAPVCAPSRSTIITGRYATALGTQAMRSEHPLPAEVTFFPALLRAAGYYCANRAKTDYNTSTPYDQAWDASGESAHWRGRRPGQPFFAMINFNQSHESSLHRRLPLKTDPARVTVPAYLPDIPEVRADIAQYHDAVARADEAIGRVLAELAADGLAEDTIVFYFGDNGGAVSRSKRFLYDNGTHVPLVIRFPARYRPAGWNPAGRRVELASFVDLAPTVLQLAGAPLPATLPGRALTGDTHAPAYVHLFRDRMDERYELSRAVTDGRWRYIRNYVPGVPWGQPLEYLSRQASFKAWNKLARAGQLTGAPAAFFAPKPVEELFDCASDPDNVRNLADDPAHAATLARFRAALRSHLLAIRDTGFIPEPLFEQLAPQESPRRISRDPGLYPLEELLDLIDAAQLRDSLVQARAVHKHPSPIVRTWGAVLAPAEFLLSDPDPMVRLGAAEGLLRAGEHAGAWVELTRAVDEPASPAHLLYALNLAARKPGAPPAAWHTRLAALAQGSEGTSGMESYVTRCAQELLARPPAAR